MGAPNNASKWQMGFNSAFKGSTDNELNDDKFICKTEKVTKERTYLYLDRFKVLTEVRLETQVFGLLRCADWQLPPFRSRIVSAPFTAKQMSLRSSETPVTWNQSTQCAPHKTRLFTITSVRISNLGKNWVWKGGTEQQLKCHTNTHALLILYGLPLPWKFVFMLLLYLD